MQMMASNLPLDFLPVHPSHSRSNSLSSVSTHSSNSRPHSSQGGLSRMQGSIAPSPDDLYRASYHLGHHNNSLPNDHVRDPFQYTMVSTENSSPRQSPPHHNLGNPSLKGHMRPSHIRARAAASPYPRDTDSVHSSSSETEDLSMFLSNPGSDYHSVFGGAHSMAPTQETVHTAGAFGRMSLNPDHALEKLAANVRAATTTSASDRAKQVFVQAWYASFFVLGYSC